MTLSLLYLYLFSFFLSITAANDWNKPCFSGVCEYDMPSVNGLSSGTLTIWGTSSSVGDITPAAGWAILSCSPDALNQIIRIACMDDGSSNCQHLFGFTSNLNDAVGKVVRLPETCGMNAFGIVTKAIVDEDQSFPVNMVRSLTRRDGTLPTVHGLHISTDPSAAVGGQQVRFSIRGSSIPGAEDPPTSVPQKYSIKQGRGLLSSTINRIKNLLNDSQNDFIFDKSNLSYIQVNRNFTLTNESIVCAETDALAKATISVETKSLAIVGYCVYASGTIMPPKVDYISLTGNMTAFFDAVMGLSANISGILDIAEVTLVKVGLPGLNFPGILSIGPSFEVSSKGTVALSTAVNMTFGINVSVNQTSFTFPQDYGNEPNVGSFQLDGRVLNAGIGQSANATGTIALHLIPSLKFGISAFGNTMDSEVFLDVDTTISATIEVTGTEQKRHLPQDEPIPPFRSDKKTDLENNPSIVSRAGLPLNSLGVCLQADAALSVNVGAVSDFFNLFNVSTQISLYNNTFPLLKKICPSITKRSWPPPIIHRERGSPKKQAFALHCLPSYSPLIPIVDNTSII